MEISNIIYYTREGSKSRTISLRELCLRDDADLEVIFHAVRDAESTQDLLDRFRRICCDPVELHEENEKYIMFTVLDVINGKTNYLKFRRKQDK